MPSGFTPEIIARRGKMDCDDLRALELTIALE
jgi:hypothetical protein